jgi:hypothetical protein
LRFHYRFLASYQAKLALGEQQEMLQYIEAHLPEFVEAYTWTELCREWLLRASINSEIPLRLEDVGSAWKRNDYISVVGINERERYLVLGTTLWNERPATLREIETLVDKTKVVLPTSQRAQWTLYYVGFAAQGWTPEAHDRSEQLLQTLRKETPLRIMGIKLIDLERVENDLANWTLLQGRTEA